MADISIPREEARRRRSHCEKLLGLLSDGNWHTQAEMVSAGGMRYGARLFEMRHTQDLTIERRQVGADEWQYRLIDPTPEDDVS